KLLGPFHRAIGIKSSGEGIVGILYRALGTSEAAGGGARKIDTTVGGYGHSTCGVGARRADITDGVGTDAGTIIGKAGNESGDAAIGGSSDIGLATRGKIGVAGGAAAINLSAAGYRQPANGATCLQSPHVLGPGRCRCDVAIGVFGKNCMAVLGRGNIETAVWARSGGRDGIIGATAELGFRQHLAFGIQLHKKGVAATLIGLTGADHTTGQNLLLAIDGDGKTTDTTADINIAAG